ncbi:MAG: general secretion pathway protein GspC [Bdellovibrionales bacterium RIFCSPHIGHO2_01_FULL_40_29]|nr:MAG: general secretion pathway protein GspC [Bdellovibrionales bacterium RIFCSPHIGHO2_01_FULL_40_29]OFZ34536.1 MAG: general secretion pathway protein GspC [Bdellovibrionales bacterium RIFCSPHIGHO2_02_FULL_40_15]
MKLGKFNLVRQKRLAQFALYGFLLFLAFSIADLTIIYIRDLMLPSEAPPQKTAKMNPQQFIDRNQFTGISSRNLFSSTGIMPEAITLKQDDTQKEDIPILSALPLNLIGTLVHSDPSKSIAAIEVKSKNLTGSFTPGSDVEGLARVERIERGIAYIRNNNTNALEYIELKSAGKVSFDASKAAAVAPAASKDVKAIAPNRFQIKRSDLLKYTNDLSSVLMQARAVPNRDPATGEINGFRLLDLQENSIFGQLGLARMDILQSVNGERIDSIQKAMETYNAMKNGNKIELGVVRNGKTEVMTYEITQ